MNASRRKASSLCMALAGLVLQAPVCTPEQAQEQFERGLTALFNVATVQLAGDVLNIDLQP